MALSRTVRLFWDIETVPNDDALQYVDMPKASKAIKDPDKIEAAVMQKYQETIDMAALDPDLCCVKSIAYAFGTDGPTTVDIVNKKMTEEAVISRFWSAVLRTQGNTVGYNILGFDWPVILRRSFELGIVPTILPSMVKFRTEPTTDLMQILSNWDWHFTKKLKWVCRRYGIEIPAGYETDGSQVEQMTDKQLRVYAESDVIILQRLYKKMQGVYFVH